jgi:hypothetical protein
MHQSQRQCSHEPQARRTRRIRRKMIHLLIVPHLLNVTLLKSLTKDNSNHQLWPGNLSKILQRNLLHPSNLSKTKTKNETNRSSNKKTHTLQFPLHQEYFVVTINQDQIN